MKKVISTIAAIGFVSSMLINTAHAGHGHLEVLNPFWLPAVILSTVAATVTTIVQPPVIFEHRGYSEPRQTVIYEEPRPYRHGRYYDRRQSYNNYYDRGRAYEGTRYRDYR